ncbi:hypothetical protein FRC02_004208 [Tulasnella sp. 418]|nr:hypothetical protein FRC02_004208 [Tulasnella sp. 418]
MIGVDGSQGGLGTKDTINSGPQLVGLISKTRPKESAVDEKAIEEPAEDIHMEEDQPQPEKSLDQIALEAVLRGGDAEDSKLQVDIIPMVKPSAMDEATAYRFDVATRPDEATLEDYTRVPVEQFGAALLRGMGWKEGAATTKNGKTAVQPYLPQQRPSLLGLGAKEKAVDNDSQPGRSNSSRNQSSRRGEPQKYIPLLKQETSGRPSSGNVSNIGNNVYCQVLKARISRAPGATRDLAPQHIEILEIHAMDLEDPPALHLHPLVETGTETETEIDTATVIIDGGVVKEI